MGKWNLEIDVEATKAAYLLRTELCSCYSCRNFRATFETFPDQLLKLLVSMGVDPENPVHTTEFGENPDGTHLYSVYYDVVGCVISGPKFSEDLPSGNKDPLSIQLFPEVNVVVWDEPSVPGHFSSPAVEIGFFLNLPWTLDEMLRE